jgi:hypothetical protein
MSMPEFLNGPADAPNSELMNNKTVARAMSMEIMRTFAFIDTLLLLEFGCLPGYEQ